MDAINVHSDHDMMRATMSILTKNEWFRWLSGERS